MLEATQKSNVVSSIVGFAAMLFIVGGNNKKRESKGLDQEERHQPKQPPK